MDEFISTESHREPWNKGKLVGQKAPFKLKEIWAIRVRLQLSERTRDLALFDLAIDSKLRACDIVKLGVRNVSHGDRIAARAIIMQQKTQATRAVRDYRANARRGFRLDPTFSFRVECIGRRTCPHGNTHASWIRGCAKSAWARPPTARTRWGGQKRL